MGFALWASTVEGHEAPRYAVACSPIEHAFDLVHLPGLCGIHLVILTQRFDQPKAESLIYLTAMTSWQSQLEHLAKKRGA